MSANEERINKLIEIFQAAAVNGGVLPEAERERARDLVAEFRIEIKRANTRTHMAYSNGTEHPVGFQDPPTEAQNIVLNLARKIEEELLPELVKV